MLIKIENCMPNDYTDNHDKLLVLTNILRSHGLNKNIVIADKETMNSVIKSNLYGQLEKIYADSILTSRREYGKLIDILSTHVVVDFSNDLNAPSTKKIGNIVQIRFPYKALLNSNIIDGTDFIAEGSIDFEYYSEIAKAYSKHISKTKLRHKFNFKLGGGSQSKDVFKRATETTALVLCLLDSDKEHPFMAEGSTSSKFQEQDRKCLEGNLAKIINVREIECLIPLKDIESVLVNNSSDKIDTLDELNNLSKDNHEFRNFFDHKEGLNLKKAIELDNKYGPFWLPQLKNINRFSKKECFQERRCIECNECPNILGFGDNLIKLTTDLIKNSNTKNTIERLDEHLIEQWHDIGKTIESWGCIHSNGLVRS